MASLSRPPSGAAASLLKKRDRTNLVVEMTRPSDRAAAARCSARKRRGARRTRSELDDENADPVSVSSFLGSRTKLSRTRNTATSSDSPSKKAAAAAATASYKTAAAADRVLDGLAVSMRMADSCNDFMVAPDGEAHTDMTLGAARSHRYDWRRFRPSPGFKKIPASLRYTHSKVDSDLIASVGNRERSVREVCDLLLDNNYVQTEPPCDVMLAGRHCFAHTFWVRNVPCYKLYLLTSKGSKAAPSVLIDYFYVNFTAQLQGFYLRRACGTPISKAHWSAGRAPRRCARPLR